jgi:hypothetical protein
MGWDPGVLRKYNTTGHFRLLNQLRSELRGNPLIRPKQGETVGAANRSKGLIRALESRPQSGAWGRRFRSTPAATRSEAAPAPSSSPTSSSASPTSPFDLSDSNGAGSFRDRLNAIEMR